MSLSKQALSARIIQRQKDFKAEMTKAGLIKPMIEPVSAVNKIKFTMSFKHINNLSESQNINYELVQN